MLLQTNLGGRNQGGFLEKVLCELGLFKIYTQFLKVTLRLQLLQNVGHIHCAMQCIFGAYFIPNSLYLCLPLCIAPAPFLLPTVTTSLFSISVCFFFVISTNLL